MRLTQRTFSERGRYQYLYVAPATILSDERLPTGEADQTLPSLRDEASEQNLCFLRVVRQLSDGYYLAHVGNSPERVDISPYIVLLSDQQLWSTLPWDCRLIGKPPKHILTQIHAHIRALQPPQTVQKSQPEPQSRPRKERLYAMETVILPEEIVTTDLKHLITKRSLRHPGSWQRKNAIQQGMLHTVVELLKAQCEAQKREINSLRLHIGQGVYEQCSILDAHEYGRYHPTDIEA